MAVTQAGRPSEREHAPFFERYISLIEGTDVITVLRRQSDELAELFDRVREERADHRYAPGKWSVRQVAGHMVDSERVFGYRALCVARGERASLPAFDENVYVDNGPFDAVPLTGFLAEFRPLRESHLFLFSNLNSDGWSRVGIANGYPVSARALAFIMAGHVRHHISVIQDRYLK